MRSIWRALTLTALLLPVLGRAQVALAGDVVREVFICKLNQGKTMNDLNKVIADFNKMIGDLKGGDGYQAELLSPIAANDMNSLIWVGEMPDSASMGALTDEYGASEAGHKMDKKFRDVMTCESRSIWRAHRLR